MLSTKISEFYFLYRVSSHTVVFTFHQMALSSGVYDFCKYNCITRGLENHETCGITYLLSSMGEHILRVQHRSIYWTYNDFTRLPWTTIFGNFSPRAPLKFVYSGSTYINLATTPAPFFLFWYFQTPKKSAVFKHITLNAFAFCFVLPESNYWRSHITSRQFPNKSGF